MSGTSDLRHEHVGVGRMLRIMEAVSARAGSGLPVATGDLHEIVGFLRVFVDRCHHGKEEEVLFPLLAAEGVTSVDETVRVLLTDHVVGRGLVARIAQATEAFESDPSAPGELASAMREYTALLHAHIRREENDCFSPADRELSAAAQQQLAEDYERIERDVIGPGVHEAFHELLDRLEHDYPKHGRPGAAAAAEVYANPPGVGRGDCAQDLAEQDAACDLESTAQVEDQVLEETKPGFGIDGYEGEEVGGG